jgi:hypothetical protein
MYFGKMTSSIAGLPAGAGGNELPIPTRRKEPGTGAKRYLTQI